MFFKEKQILLLGSIFIVLFAALLWNSFVTGGDEDFKLASVTQTSIVLGEGFAKFTHPDYRFSLEYPEDLILERFKEGEGAETIVFQGAKAREGEKLGFQIFISPYGEDEVLTKERILEDVPGAVIDDAIEVILGDGTQALLFWSESSEVGRTREVWFVHSGQLYEITTYADLDEWLANILSTWSFNEL